VGSTRSQPRPSPRRRARFDGSSMWLASVTGELLRLDSNGAVTQVVPLGSTLAFNAVFDGANLWLSSDAGLQVVRAPDGILVPTLADAGVPAAFDGSRVLVLEPQNALSVYPGGGPDTTGDVPHRRPVRTDSCVQRRHQLLGCALRLEQPREVLMKRLLAVVVAFAAVLAGGAVRIVQDQCGPFTDVTPAFCPYVLELYYLGITAGTSATTFSP